MQIKPKTRFLALLSLALLLGLYVMPAAAQENSAPTDESTEPAVTDDTMPMVQDDSAPIIHVDPISPPSPVLPDKPFVQARVVKAPRPVPTPSSRFVLLGGGLQLLPDPSISHLTVDGDGDQSATDIRNALNSIPSPAVAPLFSSIHIAQSHITLLLVKSTLVTYGATCATGECFTSAEGVWRAMPAGQREPYMVSLLQAAHANQDAWRNAKQTAVDIATAEAWQGVNCATLISDAPFVNFTDDRCHI